MGTHVDAQILALISGLSYANRDPPLYAYAIGNGIEDCRALAKEPQIAVKNIHSFGFFLVNQP